MKKELLEYIVRECVRSVLEAMPDDSTVGAPAPPADGQGTADQPPVPKAKNVGGSTPPSRVQFVNPKNPDALTPVTGLYPAQTPAQLERVLYRLAASNVGPRAKVSSTALRDVRSVLSNPNASLFLYIGKMDPDDEDLYLLSARTHQEAKENSAGADASAQHPTTAPAQDDFTAIPPGEVASQMSSGGRTQSPDIDEGVKFRNMISSMIKESLRNVKKKK